MDASVSVIIPTRNRPSDLRTTLESIALQSCQPCEVVVIDQSAVPFADSPIPLRYIHDPDIPGVCAARNIAMGATVGDIILFLDDDVILEPDFVEKLVAAYAPGITGVSGVITNYHQASRVRRLWNMVFQRGPFHEERQPIYWNYSRLTYPIRVRGFSGGLMSFRAAAIRDVRFDENFRAFAFAEDIDFCAQLPKGSVLVITPAARLTHVRSPIGRNRLHWLELETLGAHYMYRRHWRFALRDTLCFAWLNIGYLLVAVAASLRKRSLVPLRAMLNGAIRGAKLSPSPATSTVRTLQDR